MAIPLYVKTHTKNPPFTDLPELYSYRPSCSPQPKTNMKFRIPARSMSNYPNRNRAPSSYTLFTTYRHCLYISRPYHPRCQPRLDNTQRTRKRGIRLLPVSISSHWPRLILRIVQTHRNMKPRSPYFYYLNSHCLHGLSATMRTNKLLGGYCHHKLILSNPLHRKSPSRVNLGRVRSRKRNFNPLLRPTFPTTFHHCRPRNRSSHLSS